MVPVKHDILTENGMALKVKGKCELEFQLGEYTVNGSAVIAQIGVDCVMGLDFLKLSGSVVDVASAQLKVKDEVHQLTLEGEIGCFRITLCDTQHIPPMTEIVCDGRIETPPGTKLSEEPLLIESSSVFLSSGRALVARTLVKPGPVIPVRMLNPSSVSRTIYKSTEIARTSPICEVFPSSETTRG